MKKLLILLSCFLIIGCSSGSNQTTDEQRVKNQEANKARTLKAENKIKNWVSDQEHELNQNEKQEVISLVQKAKDTCEMFGYKWGSEKFADCAKEIYLKETQPKSTETTKTIIVQNDNSGAQVLADELKRQRKQQAFDELLGISQGLLSGKSVGEALSGTSGSSSSSISCFKTNERTSGTNKICSYNCMGSEVTRNIRSTQICPMSIKN